MLCCADVLAKWLFTNSNGWSLPLRLTWFAVCFSLERNPSMSEKGTSPAGPSLGSDDLPGCCRHQAKKKPVMKASNPARWPPLHHARAGRELHSVDVSGFGLGFAESLDVGCSPDWSASIKEKRRGGKQKNHQDTQIRKSAGITRVGGNQDPQSMVNYGTKLEGYTRAMAIAWEVFSHNRSNCVTLQGPCGNANCLEFNNYVPCQILACQSSTNKISNKLNFLRFERSTLSSTPAGDTFVNCTMQQYFGSLPLWHWQVVSGAEPTCLRLPKLRLICSSVACPQFCAALIEQNETVTVRGWIFFFIFYETFFIFLNLPTSYHWHKGSKNHQKALFSNTADFYNWQAVLSQNFSSYLSSPSSSDDSSLFLSASPASSAALLPFWRRRRRLRDLRNTSNASASKMWSRSCDLVQFTPCGQKPKPWKAKEEQTLQPWKFQQAMNFHLTVTLELLMIAVDWVRYTKSISGSPNGGVK